MCTRTVLGALLLLAAAGCPADDGDGHRTVNGVRYVPPDELRGWLADDPATAVVDVRILYDWRHGHVPGALSVPGLTVVDPDTLALVNGGRALTDPLPDLGTRIVFYCSGAECDVSQVVAEAARRIGYTDVWKLDGGYPAWTDAGFEAAVTVDDFCSVPYFPLAAADALIDLRDATDFAAGTIPGAINVPRSSILDTAGAPLDAGAAFTDLVTADSGLDFLLAASDADLRAVARFAADAGYRNVRLLEGTFVDWAATTCAGTAP
jgi:rhodanese-related sulfurtransferase